MTVRHMQIFRAVCEAEYNTTAAAAMLNMTQPAVSLAIKELERYYGVRLFDRIGRRLRITDAGERFLRYAINITDLFGDMETGLRDWGAGGILRVGASITIGSLFLPDHVKEFAEICPGIDVRATIEQAGRLERKLLANELDLALTEGMPHDPDIVSEAYMDDRLDVVFPADMGLKPGQTVTKEDFQSRRLLLREPGSGTRDVFDRVMENAGMRVMPVWESMSTTALLNAVAKGLGVTVLPHRMILPMLMGGRVVNVNVEGLGFDRKFYIIRHKDKFMTAAAAAFMDLCRDFGKERASAADDMR